MLKTYIKAREAVLRVARNEEGASLAEYALLIAIVLIGVGLALANLTEAVSTAIGSGESCLEASSACS